MTWAGPSVARLADGRLHLQHGPIDLVIEAVAAQDRREAAFEATRERFETVLTGLVAELPDLRRDARVTGKRLRGSVARRMAAATLPLSDRHFITPMAAVAGAVADEVLQSLTKDGQIDKAYVNNGGDIALHLSPGQSFATGLVADPRIPRLDGRFTVRAEDPVRGIATSGRHGRSLSLGIADSVTVLAVNAAAADAAATILANCVDIPGHPAIERRPAQELDPDSDLGDRQVTVGLDRLDEQEAALALDRGLQEAEYLRRVGLIHAAVLTLNGQVRVCDAAGGQPGQSFAALVPGARKQPRERALHA